MNALIKRLLSLIGFDSDAALEADLVNQFRKYPYSYKELASWCNDLVQPFHCVGRNFYSQSRLIHVCHDIYGYEVKVGRGASELLDCRPSYYGLNHDQAHELYTAILSCVPGSVFFVEKQTRLHNIPEKGKPL